MVSAGHPSPTPSGIHWKPIVRQGLAWIHRRTALPILAPTHWPFSVQDAYGFSSQDGYGLSFVAAASKTLPFNDPKLASGQVGKLVTSYSVAKLPPEPGVSTDNLLASYNLLGPSGMPALAGGTVKEAGQAVHWSARQHLLWWIRGSWTFLVDANSESAAWQAARPIMGHWALPQAPGLVVVTQGATMVDWMEHALIASVSGQAASPRQVLRLVSSFQKVSPTVLSARG